MSPVVECRVVKVCPWQDTLYPLVFNTKPWSQIPLPGSFHVQLIDSCMEISNDRLWPWRGGVLAGQMSAVLRRILPILCSFPGCQGLALASILKSLASIPSRLFSLVWRGDWRAYRSCVHIDHSDNM